MNVDELAEGEGWMKGGKERFRDGRGGQYL